MSTEKNQDINLLDVIGQVTPKTKEDLGFEKTGDLDEKTCPYNVCNGSGFIKDPKDSTKMIFCKCGLEDRMRQKLHNANIEEHFYDKDFSSFDDQTKAYLFKPLKTPVPFKPTAKMKDVLTEPSEAFIKRKYEIVPQDRSINNILESFAEKNLAFLNEDKKTANLLMFGDSGNGKTTFAELVGTYFLKHDKKVYFSTTQDFLDMIFNSEIDPKTIARKYDVLILDELFNEYHTNTEYAKKQLKEIFKIREKLGKMTICTSNGNPKDFSLLYGDSIMSLINGTFFLFMLERDTDARVEEMHSMYNDFGL